MAIFISYSHKDAAFVDRLAVRLAEERVHVWLDRLELQVGDSLTQRIQAALERASAILVVLSPASVESEWCRRELTAGLVRELEERRVLVLPVLIEECSIPLFLRDKLRVDLSGDFEGGLAKLVSMLAPLTNPSRGRLEEPRFLIDYAIDFFEAEHFYRRLTLVEHSPDLPYIAITELHTKGDQGAIALFKAYADVGLDWWVDLLIVEMLASSISPKLKLVLDDCLPKSLRFEFHDAKINARYQVEIQSRLLGTDTGNSVVLHVGHQLQKVFNDQRRARRALTADEQARVAELRSQRGL
jgi:hypothetical protein